MDYEQRESIRHKADSHFLLSVENLDSSGVLIDPTCTTPDSPQTAIVRFTFDDGVQFMINPLDMLDLSMEGILPVILPKKQIN